MADTKLADLTALTAPSGDDLLYVVDDPAGTPADRKLALDNLFTRGTVTASSPVIDAAQTWNNAAVTFTSLKLNVTDTASASGSLLLDLQVGGTSRLSVNKNGTLTIATTGGTFAFNGSTGFDVGTFSILRAASMSFGPSNDVQIRRRGAANLQLGAGDAASPVAQTLGVQSVVAGTTNTAGANFTIAGSQGTGTGAGGSIIFQVAPAGSSGFNQNALATALTITGTQRVQAASWFDALTGIVVGSGAADIIIAASATYWLTLRSTATLGWASGDATATRDTILARDAANTLAQRNGTNAQAFNIYNTYTDASNYERGFVRWSSNVLRIGTEKAGTGTARALEFQTDGTTRLTIADTGAATFSGTITGTILILGTAGVIRLGSINNGNNTRTFWTLDASSDVATFAIGLTSPIMRFSGATSSFPALKRSSTTLQVRLADDSANAPLESASVKTDAPAGGTSGTWKLGVAASVSPTSPNRTIEVDIGGTIYYIHAKTTND